MPNKVPALITLGEGRDDLQKFDDRMQLGNEEFRISGVKISLDDKNICGIAFIYQNLKNGNKILCNDTCITGKHITQYDFEIDQNDFIQALFGYYESGITQIGIVTYKGQQAIFGKDQGYKFQHMFMGYTFTGCSGTYKKGLLQSLTFKVVKLPKEFLAQHFTPLLQILYPENPYESIILTKFELEQEDQYEQQPQSVMQPTSEIIYQMIPSQLQQAQSGYPVQNQQVFQNQIPPYGNLQQQQNQYQTYQQYPDSSQQYCTTQYGTNQTIIVNQQQQPQQQQYNQQQGPGFAGTMAKTAIGTFAAIETVRMIENIGHHPHHQANVVLVDRLGNNHHGHHHHR